ncbi:hypothetical protein SCALM49S_00585 [Streptomyces californicus]
MSQEIHRTHSAEAAVGAGAEAAATPRGGGLSGRLGLVGPDAGVPERSRRVLGDGRGGWGAAGRGGGGRPARGRPRACGPDVLATALGRPSARGGWVRGALARSRRLSPPASTRVDGGGVPGGGRRRAGSRTATAPSTWPAPRRGGRVRRRRWRVSARCAGCCGRAGAGRSCGASGPLGVPGRAGARGPVRRGLLLRPRPLRRAGCAVRLWLAVVVADWPSDAASARVRLAAVVDEETALAAAGRLRVGRGGPPGRTATWWPGRWTGWARWSWRYGR